MFQQDVLVITNAATKAQSLASYMLIAFFRVFSRGSNFEKYVALCSQVVGLAGVNAWIPSLIPS